MELMHNYPIAQILVIAMIVVLSYWGVGKRRKRPKPVVSIWYARYPLNKYDIPTVLNKVTDSSTYVLNKVYFNSDKKHIYIYVKAYTEDEATAAARSQVDVYKKTTVHRELIYEHITLPAQDPRLRATATGHSHMITVAHNSGVRPVPPVSRSATVVRSGSAMDNTPTGPGDLLYSTQESNVGLFVSYDGATWERIPQPEVRAAHAGGGSNSVTVEDLPISGLTPSPATAADLQAALSGASEADSRYHSIYPMGVNEGSAASSTRTDHDHTVIGVDQGGPDPVIEGVNITYTFREKECKPKKNIGRDLVIFTK